MNEQRTKAIEKIKERIVKLARISAAIESLPNFETRTIYESCEEICMTIPYDPERIREVRGILGASWKVLDAPRVMDSGSWVVRYQNVNDPEMHITLFADAYGEGATCHRVKVGIKEQPVYKIVCGDELVEA